MPFERTTYKLKSFNLQNGEGLWQPWGENFSGLLIYSPDGFMSASINKNIGHAGSAPDDVNFFSGRYRISGNQIYHAVENATDIERVGKEMVRTFEFADEELTLTGFSLRKNPFKLVWMPINPRNPSNKMLASTPEPRFIGSWRLKSNELEDDKGVMQPWGGDLRGIIIYTADGHMSVAQNKNLKSKTYIPEEFIFYSGQYSVNDGKVFHHVSQATNFNRIGTTLERNFTFVGDDLILSGSLLDGKRYKLTWTRATT